MKHTRVLNWVNRIRREHFGKGPLKRLPRGVPLDNMACPIHNCFYRPGSGYAVFPEYMSTDALVVRLPRHVTNFIYEFDNWEYPELVKK